MGFPTLFWRHLTVLNTETWWVGFFCIEEPEKKKVLERNAGLSMKVNPITSADVCRKVFLNWCSAYCLPVWVSLICSELFWLLSFSQIKAKRFYLMFYFLFFWPDNICIWYILWIWSFYLYSHFLSFCILIYLLKIKLHGHIIGGFLLQLGTEDLKAIVPQREANPELLGLMSSAL